MLIASIADVHVGNHTAFAGVEVGRINQRCQQILDCLQAATQRALAFGCTALVVAGDVFDTDHPFPDHLAEVLGIFRAAAKRGLMVYILVGNHDQHSNTPGDNALTVFRYDFPVYETPDYIDRVPRIFMCPFGHDPLKHTVQADIVIAHHGISEDTTHPAKANGAGVLRWEAIKAWMGRQSVGYYLAGDWHEHRTWWDNRICQIGALAPVNWQNRAYTPGKVDPYGSLILIGDHGLSREVIPGPRFLKAVDDAEAVALYKAAASEGHKPYIDLIGSDGKGIPPELEEFIRNSGSIETKYGAVLQVVQELNTTSTLDEQVREYIQNDQEIPDPLRQRVLDAVLRAMKEARCQP